MAIDDKIKNAKHAIGEIPKGIKLPNPANSIIHEDVAPVVEVNYNDDTEASITDRC